MPLTFRMRDSLDSVQIKGGFEEVISKMNLQMSQQSTFIVLQRPDDTPIAVNVKNINTIEAESLEDAFFPRES
jgi:hypothetical protein